MVVDGVGSYCGRRHRGLSGRRPHVAARPRIGELLQVQGSKLEALKKVWLEPSRGFLSDEFYNMAGPRRGLQPRLELHLRRLEQVRRADGACALWPAGPDQAAHRTSRTASSTFRTGPRSSSSRGCSTAVRTGRRARPCSTGRTSPGGCRTTPRRCCCIARRWLRETTGAKNLCIAGGVALNCVANGRIVREAGFDNVWIQPAAGDDGIAIGCAYYGHLALQKQAAQPTS